MSVVALTQDHEIEQAISQTFTLLDLNALFTGKLVAIKPNETWASAEDCTGVTQPDSLRAVIRQIKQWSPREIVITGGAGAAETDEVFRIAGLMAVVEEEGARVFDHNRPPFVSVPLEYGGSGEVDGPQREVMVNPQVLHYDRLVAVNQLKLHETATVALALKNIGMSYPAADYYGRPRSGQRHRHHFFDDMHSFIAAMARRFPIDLAVTVGHPAMIGTGPLGGHVVETGLVVASRDAMSADAVGARLLVSVQAVRHLWEAARLCVGESIFDRMEFRGLPLREAIGAFTEAAYGKRLTFDHA